MTHDVGDLERFVRGAAEKELSSLVELNGSDGTLVNFKLLAQFVGLVA